MRLIHSNISREQRSDNPELSMLNCLLKPGAGLNIASHTWTAARHFIPFQCLPSKFIQL